MYDKYILTGLAIILTIMLFGSLIGLAHCFISDTEIYRAWESYRKKKRKDAILQDIGLTSFHDVATKDATDHLFQYIRTLEERVSVLESKGKKRK